MNHIEEINNLDGGFKGSLLIEINKYLEQTSEIERKIIKIAEDTLGSSFNINRSLGFIEWKNKNLEPEKKK